MSKYYQRVTEHYFKPQECAFIILLTKRNEYKKHSLPCGHYKLTMSIRRSYL